MKLIKKLIFGIYLLSLPLFAQADANADLLLKLKKFQQVEAHFTQTIRDSKGRVLDHSKGKMWIHRPGKFRWEILSPQNQLIIANQETVWIYDQDLEQATKRREHSENLSPAALLSAPDQKLMQGFLISEIQPNQFQLKPRSKKNALFSSMVLIFEEERLKAIRLQDPLGQLTQIVFSNLRYPASLPNTLFIFTPPPGTDLIENG